MSKPQYAVHKTMGSECIALEAWINKKFEEGYRLVGPVTVGANLNGSILVATMELPDTDEVIFNQEEVEEAVTEEVRARFNP